MKNPGAERETLNETRAEDSALEILGNRMPRENSTKMSSRRRKKIWNHDYCTLFIIGAKFYSSSKRKICM